MGTGRQYSSGLRVIEKVDSLRSSLDGKPLSRKQKRTKVTESIARQKSRQECLPLAGKLIAKAHVEPLHLKNNAWGIFSKYCLRRQWQNLTYQQPAKHLRLLG